jgi:hypothetical protein
MADRYPFAIRFREDVLYCIVNGIDRSVMMAQEVEFLGEMSRGWVSSD